MSFSIKELESLSGIKAHTIRIWEQRYNFLKPSRTLTNIRTYSNEDLKTILTVALLNKHGFKISRIDAMAPDEWRQQVLHLTSSEAQDEQLVNDLIAAMIDLDFVLFEKLLTRYITAHCISIAISGIVFQFLEKVGILWQTSRINPAQEHVASCVIRQKLIAAIDALPLAARSGPLYLLLLPEGEFHELGLLFVYYLLKKRGVPVMYLGANMPAKDIVYVVEQKRPAAIYLHLSSYPVKQNFHKLLHQLSERTHQLPMLLSGSLANEYRKPLPANVQTLRSLAAVTAHINSI